MLVSCREPRCVADALTRLATSKGLPRSKLLSQMIHESMQNNAEIPLLQYAWRRDKDMAESLRSLRQAMRGLCIDADLKYKSAAEELERKLNVQHESFRADCSAMAQFIEHEISGGFTALPRRLTRTLLLTIGLMAIALLTVFILGKTFLSFLS